MMFPHLFLDFKNKDYIKQVSTESLNTRMLEDDKQLLNLLHNDDIAFDDISDYHCYPIADNDLPRLSADRLEYMFSTGLIMTDIWSLERIQACYQNIMILQNEDSVIELGFVDKILAIEYCVNCTEVGKLYLTNKNKVALQLLADIIDKAIDLQLITEKDLYRMTEKEVWTIFSLSSNKQIQKLWYTFINFTTVLESDKPIEDSYCVSLEVKKDILIHCIKTKEFQQFH